MKNVTFAKTAIVSAALLLASLSSASAEQTKRWDMCNWQNIPENVVQRITNRADYDDILRRMFDACPDSALSLTDRPTASIATNQDSAGRVNSGGESGGIGGNPGGGGGNTPGNGDTPSEGPGSLPG